MMTLYCARSEWLPRWDGRRVLFEITDRGTQVQCAISQMALENIENAPCSKAEDWIDCFARARGRIEALARDKLHARSIGVTGRLSLWADDFDQLPPGGVSASVQHA